MANIKEWIKGISVFVFVTIMFYFFWENIFLTIINFLGTDLYGIGAEASTSLTILKSIGWVSFIAIWLVTCPTYLIFAITAGARDEVITKPLDIIKGIGIWVVAMPLMTVIYGIIHFMVSTLNDSNIMETALETTATQFSWIFGIILFGAFTALPFYFILRGYGIDIGKGGKS